MQAFQKHQDNGLVPLFADSINPSSSIIINIISANNETTINMPFTIQLNPALGESSVSKYTAHTIYNFDPQIQTINLTSGSYLQGSLLAPSANVLAAKAGSSINGQLIAQIF